jgi:oxygen-independent coproporphyrinogen-3 oxidase
LAAEEPIGAYIHWPFCLSKCPYCDFNSHVRETIDEARWQSALMAEIDHAAVAEAPRRSVGSVFFGGGTPSLMAPATVGAVLDRLAQRFAMAADAEITLEANPTSVEAGRFRGYRAAGVNRVSVGVQALDDAALGFLGRHHSAAEAVRAVATAVAVFPRASLDLIYARPGQTAAAWRGELADALALGTEHVSVYQLTIEPGTKFHTLHRRGDLAVPDEDTASALWDVTQEVLDGAGLEAYEVSNHARPGAACRHNLVYWRAGEWIGLGPGAHGRLGAGATRRGTVRARAPETWLGLVETRGHGTETDQPIERDVTVAETLMMGMRLAEGIGRNRFAQATGCALDDVLRREILDPLVAGGFLVADAAGVRATPAGRAVLNAVLARLMP